MMNADSQIDCFYDELPLFKESVSHLLGMPERFDEVPRGWHVVVTDIKGSTQAVEAGLHDNVNLVATGSIIAALNIAYARQLTIPFFFGGDGATLLVPDSILEVLLKALETHRANTALNFGMDLRVGAISVQEVYAAGHKLGLAKARINELFSIPVILGDGLSYAEALIKSRDKTTVSENEVPSPLNLEGMECRWNHVKPPVDRQEVVCLLAVAREASGQAACFREVLELIDEIYGPPAERQPISIQRLQLNTTFGKISREIKTRLGRFNWAALLGAWIQTLIGKWYYFPFDKGGKAYLRTLVEMADTLVLDGRINTVMTGTVGQRERLRGELDRMEAESQIWYGMYASEESVMSCYVRDRQDGHIHFVDGAGGGYTQAARVLKAKMRKA